ncbi:MAG: hypothetical protein HN929_03835 [Chloroflexi bacterium]|jgi:hypothetical protein|nr:hypothetical protein [Candidatus Neomarinimicrobiota bacterium]MBT6079102.1 hypothetical protein [Gammaproteobacteria bacterium]MBT7080585.1 hypothetical protein [Chloroflexota bacterium]MBT7830442.1 hypothetical protein [Candidatus Neomarinimicrobiota bacterium]
MSDTPEWLPPLVLFADYSGDWDAYLDAVYAFFWADFVEDKPIFQGSRLGLKKYPETRGKEATFWHMIQEGAVEEERTPDFRRCERIRWPRPIIENSTDAAIKVWRNTRKGGERICLWFEEDSYLVVLADRGKYILPWTAYPVEREHQQRKLQREYEEYCRTTAQKG